MSKSGHGPTERRTKSASCSIPPKSTSGAGAEGRDADVDGYRAPVLFRGVGSGRSAPVIGSRSPWVGGGSVIYLGTTATGRPAYALVNGRSSSRDRLQ